MKLTVIGMVFLAGALILSAPAHAGLHHDHHSSGSLSHKASKGKPHHCVLLGHSISNPCPHILQPNSLREKVAIGMECGGLPFPSKAIPLHSLQKIFSKHENLVLTALAGAEKYFRFPDLYGYSTVRSIDPPPKY